jgi:zinc protease
MITSRNTSDTHFLRNLSYAARTLARMHRLLFRSLLLAALASCAAGAAQPTSDLAANAEITWGRLDNGVRYALWPLPKAREVSLRLLVEAGSLNEADEERGLAHFVEHMAFNGSEHRPPGAMVAEMQQLGLVTGTHNTALAAPDHTLYKLDLPDASAQSIAKGLFILRETAGSLTFPGPQIEQERQAVLAEMRAHGGPQLRRWEEALTLVFGDWLAKRWPIGARSVIERAQREDLVRFYHRWYRPQRMVVIAAGPIAVQEFERLMQARFGDLRARDSASAQGPALPPLVARGPAIRLVSEPGNNVALVLLAAEPLNEYRDSFAERETAALLELASRILGRRLFDRSFAAGASFSVTRVATWVQFRRARIGAIELATTGAHWPEAIAAAEQELRRALRHGFTAAEISAAKAELRASWQQQVLAQAAGLRSIDAAEALAKDISSNLVTASLKPTIARLDKAIEPVGSDALQAALRALWTDGDRRWLLSGPLEGEISKAAVAGAIKQSEAVAVQPPEGGTEKRFAYESFGAPGVLVYRDTPRSNLTVAALANGSRATVLGGAGAKQVQVAVDVIGGGRMSQPKEQDGLAYLADQYFLAGGLGAHSFREIDRFLKSRSVELRFAVTDSKFQFTVSAPAKELPFALRVISAYLSDPGFREEGWALAKGSLERVVAEVRATPAGVIEHYLPRRRCAGDPRCGLPDLETLKARRWEELQAWLAPLLREAALSVTVVGDIGAEAALGDIAATIGALPLRRPASGARSPEIELPTLQAGAVETLTYAGKGSHSVAMAVVEFPMPRARDHPEWVRQELVSRLLAERIRERLRVAEGESYGPNVMQLPGWLRVRVDAAPDRVREAARRVTMVVREVATRPFSEEEISRVVPVALRQEEESRRQAHLWLEALRAQSDAAAAYDRVLDKRGIIERSTPGEINALARDVLKPDGARTYLVVPAITSSRGEPRDHQGISDATERR